MGHPVDSASIVTDVPIIYAKQYVCYRYSDQLTKIGFVIWPGGFLPLLGLYLPVNDRHPRDFELVQWQSNAIAQSHAVIQLQWQLIISHGIGCCAMDGLDLLRCCHQRQRVDLPKSHLERATGRAASGNMSKVYNTFIVLAILGTGLAQGMSLWQLATRMC